MQKAPDLWVRGFALDGLKGEARLPDQTGWAARLHSGVSLNFA